MKFSRKDRAPRENLVLEVVFLVPVIVAVGMFGNLARQDVLYTIILTIVFAVNIIIRFIVANQRHDWIFFVLGIVAGGGNDLLSMLNGVYDYTSITIIPWLSGLMPAWNICFWGQVFLLFRKVFHVDWFCGEPFKKDGFLLGGWIHWKLLVDIACLAILRGTIYATHEDPVLPGIIYGLVVLARMLVIRPKRNEWNIIAILPYAFMFEGLMVTFGLYVYKNPVFLGLPAWLMLWWTFLVPLLLKHVFDMIEYYLGNLEGGKVEKQEKSIENEPGLSRNN